MKRKPILKKQTVGRNKGGSSEFRRLIRRIGSWFIRASFLLMALIAISFLFVSLYGYLLTSPYIRLEQIVVTGVDEGLKGQLIEMAKLDFEASLLAINLQELEKNLERNPWVRSLRLEKHFPHTLMIRVEKEEPWAIVAMGKLYYLNRWGKIFKVLDQGDETDFPVITGISGNDEAKEKLVNIAMEVLKVLEAQNDPWSMNSLSELHVRKDGEVALYFSQLAASIRIRGSSLAGRMDDLKKVVEHLNSTSRIHTVKAINLTYEEGAVVAFKKS